MVTFDEPNKLWDTFTRSEFSYEKHSIDRPRLCDCPGANKIPHKTTPFSPYRLPQLIYFVYSSHIIRMFCMWHGYNWIVIYCYVIFNTYKECDWHRCKMPKFIMIKAPTIQAKQPHSLAHFENNNCDYNNLSSTKD